MRGGADVNKIQTTASVNLQPTFVIMMRHSDTQGLVGNLFPGVAGVAAQLQQSLNAGGSHVSSSQQSRFTH